MTTLSTNAPPPSAVNSVDEAVSVCIFLYVLLKKALLHSKALFALLPESAL